MQESEDCSLVFRALGGARSRCLSSRSTSSGGRPTGTSINLVPGSTAMKTKIVSNAALTLFGFQLPVLTKEIGNRRGVGPIVVVVLGRSRRVAGCIGLGLNEVRIVVGPRMISIVMVSIQRLSPMLGTPSTMISVAGR